MNIFSTIFGEEKGDLAQSYPGFESRDEQVAMGECLQFALDSGQHAVVEAGTGVGKSLAYLLSVIEWSKRTGKRVVISTFTKTLQQQLVQKDLPQLQKILGMEFKYALCVGSHNFLCKRRFHKNGTPGLFAEEDHKQESREIQGWIETTESGLVSDLPFIPSPAVWNHIRRESDLCLNKKSQYYEECFYQKKRKEILAANILIVNHHLFFAHVASGGKVLPKFDAVVFDEAHTLEDVATSYLGKEVNNTQLDFHLNAFWNPKRKRGSFGRIKGLSQRHKDEGSLLVSGVRDAAKDFFQAVITKFGVDQDKVRVKHRGLVGNGLKQPVNELNNFLLQEVLTGIQNKDDEVELIGFVDKMQEIVTTIDEILEMQVKDNVYWVEFQQRARGVRCALKRTPLDIAEQFQQEVLENIDTCIFTSATLSINGRFDYFKKSLGLDDEVLQLQLDSPFNYPDKVTLYLPQSMPDPGRETNKYIQQALDQVKLILHQMQGRTFVLFTNYALMCHIANLLREDEAFAHLQILRQGEAPRYQLIEEFQRPHKSVLLATNTFWQGVDIPGEALECVILWKLPFGVPDDPFIEAKGEHLMSQGKNVFTDFQLPRAIMLTRQGFGRLIRTQTDQGMVAILDPRVKTKSYGQEFLNSLPICRHVSDLEKLMV